MSILLDRTNRVLVQGVTGQMGTYFVEDACKYGTTVVAGVSPGRDGAKVGDVPVFGSVRAAREATGADTAIVFVPPAAVLGGALEAIEAGCRLVVVTADELPVLDTIELKAAARANGAAVVGPNSPGIISPGKAKLGFMPSFCYMQGNVGVISRSGSLSYECCKRLTLAGMGQSTVIGIGGDPVKGTTAAEALGLFHDDPETAAVLYLGEIGGSEESFVAEYAARPDAKPVAALIVGHTAPPGRKMGHAAALIGSKAESHAAKVAMMRSAGVHVASGLSDMVETLQAALSHGMRAAQDAAA
ncbi:MAG: CoA-binding protein [Betaproteobacteria bacterium]|nr:CoA-binding protein [Betaproteobacteria bacterium]